MKLFQLSFLAATLVIASTFLTGCQKENIDPGPTPPENQKPGSSDTYTVKVKAVISIGHIVYDSIPATLHITTWDANNVEHSKDTIISAGANVIRLPKSHVKYRFSISQWGITEVMTFNKAEMDEGTVIALGGHREPRKLKKEETYAETTDAWRPQSRVLYNYNTDGSLKKVDYYQNYTGASELTLANIDRYAYDNGNVSRIDRFDGNDSAAGFTEFSYTPQGKVKSIHQKMNGTEINVNVAVNPGGIDMNYFFSNGNSFSYNMVFKGGNSVHDEAHSNRGTGQDGNYTYDAYINPYAHMNMPDLFLSHQSRNNITGADVLYWGDFPVVEPVKSEYKYDAEGYPVEKVTSYRGYGTNKILYHEKTVYTY